MHRSNSTPPSQVRHHHAVTETTRRVRCLPPSRQRRVRCLRPSRQRCADEERTAFCVTCGAAGGVCFPQVTPGWVLIRKKPVRVGLAVPNITQSFWHVTSHSSRRAPLPLPHQRARTGAAHQLASCHCHQRASTDARCFATVQHCVQTTPRYHVTNRTALPTRVTACDKSLFAGHFPRTPHQLPTLLVRTYDPLPSLDAREQPSHNAAPALTTM